MHKTAASAVDWKAIREDFPILREQAHGHPLIYFDNAATSQKPRAIIEAIQNFYEHDNANVHRGLHTLSSRATEAYENARQRVAEYIGAASPGEIIFTRGTTESINLVAQAWGGKFIHEGDVILLTVMEHHSNLVPWQLLAERTGARLRFVPVLDDGTLDLEQLSSLLTPEVKLFAFTHISNSLGTINPVAEPSAEARAVGRPRQMATKRCWVGRRGPGYNRWRRAGEGGELSGGETAAGVGCLAGWSPTRCVLSRLYADEERWQVEQRDARQCRENQYRGGHSVAFSRHYVVLYEAV